jgi:hypothetical protein
MAGPGGDILMGMARSNLQSMMGMARQGSIRTGDGVGADSSAPVSKGPPSPSDHLGPARSTPTTPRPTWPGGRKEGAPWREMEWVGSAGRAGAGVGLGGGGGKEGAPRRVFRNSTPLTPPSTPLPPPPSLPRHPHCTAALPRLCPRWPATTPRASASARLPAADVVWPIHSSHNPPTPPPLPGTTPHRCSTSARPSSCSLSRPPRPRQGRRPRRGGWPSWGRQGRRPPRLTRCQTGTPRTCGWRSCAGPSGPTPSTAPPWCTPAKAREWGQQVAWS